MPMQDVSSCYVQLLGKHIASSNKCLTSSNKDATSNKKLLVTRSY